MANRSLHPLIHQLLRRIGPDSGGVSDGQLLERFVNQKDEAAFETLVWRHGSLVLGVCRRILRDPHDAEDAFQATFLVLFRKAGSISRRQSAGSWLFKVAYRVALKARARKATRPAEEELVDPPAPESPSDLDWQDLRPALDDALDRLPEKYRAPLVLHYLEGKTVEQIAGELACPSGTVSGRLDRAKHLLRKRLVRQGLTLSAAAFASALATSSVAAQAPARLVACTVQAAATCAAGKAAGAISAPVAALVEGVLRSMFMTKIKLAAALFMSFCVLAAGAGLVAQQAGAVHEPDAPQVAQAPALRPPQPKAPRPKARLDLYGDPLPHAAVARLGTVRGGHRAPIQCMAFTPDNKALFSYGNGDITIRSWDVATGKETRRLHQPLIFFARAAFAPDAKTAALLEHQTIYLWDLAAGKEIRRFALPFFAVHLAFAPDGKTLAVGGILDNTIRLWDVAAGKEIRRLGGHKDFVDSLTFSPDGKMLATGSRDKTVRLWDVAEGKEIRQLGGHEGWIGSVVFAPDGKTLASADNNVIRLWDVAEGKEIRRLEKEKQSQALLAFSPDGKVLASGGFKAVRLWEAATGQEICHFDMPKDSGGAAVAFSPDGKTLAWACGHQLSLCDVAAAKNVRRLDGWKLKRIESVAFAPDGKTLASGGQDNAIRLWDADTGKEIRRLEGHKESVVSVVFAPDGKTLASAGYDKTVRLWDVAAGKEIRRFEWNAGVLSRMTFSPDAKVLITGGSDGMLRIWDVASGKEIRQVNVPNSIQATALSPDGRTVAHVVRDTILLVDIATGKEVRQSQVVVGNGSPFSAAFSPDGRTLAVAHGSGDHRSGSIHLWDVATGKEIRRLDERRGAVYSVVFSPDGKTFASAGFGETIRLWETATGKEIRQFEGHEGRIMSLAFAPDGARLASVSEDATILLWDVQRFGRPRQSRNFADKDLQGLWTTLAGADARKAYDAIADLTNAPQQAVPFLQKHLPPPPAVEPQRLARLIADLDNQKFAARQNAAEELEKLGPATEAALRTALAGKPSLEVRQRLEQLLAKVTALSPEGLRELRAIQALERAATPEAKQLLQTLAQKSGYSQRTREDAQAALARLAKRAAGK